MPSGVHKLTKSNPDVRFLLGLLRSKRLTGEENPRDLQKAYNGRFKEYKTKNFRQCFRNLVKTVQAERPSPPTGMLTSFFRLQNM